MSALNDALWQLLPSLSGLPSDGGGLLFVMQAYVDDSVESPVFVLAGFVARAEQWGEIDGRVARRAGWAATARLFQNERNPCSGGAVQGMSEPVRYARLADFVGIVKCHVLAGVSSVVRQDDFGEVLRSRIAKPLDNSYWLMYHSIITLIFEWNVESGLVEKVDLSSMSNYIKAIKSKPISEHSIV
jgi:hypothetical protein